MAGKEIVLNEEDYESIVTSIDSSGDALLEKTDCYEPEEVCLKNIVVPDYKLGYESLIQVINYLMAVNDKVVVQMNNVLAYHKGIDQKKSDQLKEATPVVQSGDDSDG